MRNIYRETFEQVRAPEDLWREIREIPAREQRPVRRFPGEFWQQS